MRRHHSRGIHQHPGSRQKHMRYIHPYNKRAAPLKWKYSDPTRHIRCMYFAPSNGLDSAHSRTNAFIASTIPDARIFGAKQPEAISTDTGKYCGHFDVAYPASRARNAAFSDSRNSRRSRSGRTASAISGSANRRTMCCEQFQSKASRCIRKMRSGVAL